MEVKQQRSNSIHGGNKNMTHIHTFEKSEFPDYEKCIGCGSYHSTAQDPPELIYEIEEYWSYDNHRSKFEEQIKNLNEEEGTGISKIDMVLKYVPPHAQMVLEGGCSPGELLRRLVEKGITAIGIEPSMRYVEPILRQAPGSHVIHGYFPQVFSEYSGNILDALIFMDVFEHIDDTESFIKAAHRLLKPNGALICMSPVIMPDGAFRERDFIAREHCWLYHFNFLDPYLKSFFKDVKWDIWVLGHNVFVATK